jgi:DNA-binding NarL/FixJ family response regulator
MRPSEGDIMKKEHYYFDMPKETYDFIIKKGILRESKKEKTILDLCMQGEPLKSIMIRTGYSSRTINYRKKEIYSKISKYFF